MGLKAWASTVAGFRRTLIALVTAFAGVGPLIDALFWGPLARVMPSASAPIENRGGTDGLVPHRNAFCQSCGTSLSPAVSTVRCACGLYSHRACIGATGRCERSGRAQTLDNTAYTHGQGT
jgi:hypothetical protein